VQHSFDRDDFGVADGWWAVDGSPERADPDAVADLRRALGADEHPDGPPEGPPVWFVHPGDTHEVWSPGVVDLEDGGEVAVRDRLPPDLPLGGHLLRSGGVVTRLFVVPRRCPSVAETLGGRAWGWAVQVPAARSAASWGHGDLADLRTLAGWTASAGGRVLAHSPLGAPLPTPSQQPSPYYASSRRFWSPLVLRVEEVDGAAGVQVVDDAAAAGRALLADRRIDRDEVWRLKRDALGAVWAATRSSAATRAALDDVRGDGELSDFATFCALAEHHGSGWSTWPEEHRHPRNPAVARFAADRADDVDRWRWLQVQTDRQLARAAAAGVALMADLPVGFDPDGADAWVDQDLLAIGCRIGAPPDEFNRDGQDWGLPPYVPWRLRAAGYGPWRDTLRRVLRHAGTLRVDHVMGLFRLYLVPPGRDARTGAYVYQPGADLFELACLEATLAGAVLVGEDLGTVEPEVRDAMARRGVLGYRVGWFEDSPSASWPATSVAMLTTHDLPTAAGLLGGHDAAARAEAGLAPDPEGDAVLRRRLDALAAADGAAPGDVAPPGEVPPVGAQPLTTAAYTALARSGSDLVVVTLEDAVGQVERPNLPGTLDEHPNWRLALPVPIERLDDAGAGDLAAAVATARPATAAPPG
jgi:4-alpha-glucanotransferase